MLYFRRAKIFCNFLNCSNLWELLLFLIASTQIASKSWQGPKISAHAMLGVIFVRLTICTGSGSGQREKLANHYCFNFTPERPTKIYGRPSCCNFLQILFLSWRELCDICHILCDVIPIPIRILWTTKSLKRYVYLAVKYFCDWIKTFPIRRLPDIWRLQNGLSSNQNIRIGRQIFIDAV